MHANATTQPTVYIPHGAGPCFFMDWTMGPANTWDRLRDWLSAFATRLPAPPAAILVVSGHWESADWRVTASRSPALIYDYGGFPPHTYQLRYDAPGDPALAAQIVHRLQAAGLPATGDPQRGLDHGVFIPLKLMFPQARIPVLQLSLQAGLDPQAHLDLGHALAPLREQGVLIVGSGMSWHNMRGFSPRYTQASAEFDHWLGNALADPDPARREAALLNWTQAPHARLAHPREEHLLPLLVAAGAAMEQPGQRVFTDQVMDVVVSAFQFG